MGTDQKENSLKSMKSDFLAGKLLMAMPSMSDKRFHHAVILVCAHDKKGAMGLVINQTLPDLKFQDLLIEMGIQSNITINHSLQSFSIMNGGPVDIARGFLLHSDEYKVKDTVHITEGLKVTGTKDILVDIAEGKGPKQALFMLGYAGWGAGQLEEELRQNVWLVSDPDPGLVFLNQHEIKWHSAIKKIGFEPSMLSSFAGHG